MKQSRQKDQQKTPSHAIQGNVNNLEKLLNHPDLKSNIWPTILSWLTRQETKPDDNWKLHPTHPTIRAQIAHISTTNKATINFEVHLLHYDIYFCLKGSEIVSFFWFGDVSKDTSYDITIDNLFCHPTPEIKPTQLTMTPGAILILPPGEAHLPVQPSNGKFVTKVIAKIPRTVVN